MQRPPPQQNGNAIDRNGTLTGKENIAPGGMREEKALPLAISSVAKPTARPRPSVSARGDSVLLAKPASSIIARNTIREPVPRTASQSPEQQGREKVARLATSASTAHRASTQQKGAFDLRNYPSLQEDIAHAWLFEESWLTNQEHVLVELINEVFAQSEAARLVPKHKTLREMLLQFYQDHATLRLHQRLQASLQFGTLSVPKDSDCKNETYRYTKDVGRRQRFVRLWTQTYMPTFLRAALEAVTGRQMKAKANEPCTSRDLTVFVEGFLLRNEDAQSPSHLHSELDTTAWAWRRTMQRSLMLVYMLDKAKESLSLDGNLFRPKSPYKTSAAVLSELSNILHPSERSVQQCLSRLGYKVTYEQHPLADYPWPIANLAVDLRDGIRLARLIELLLPPRQPAHADFKRRPSWNNADRDAVDPNSTGRCLAPRLRVPCNSRAAMLANNELVLRAMRDSHCLDAALQEIEAVDLADGHRERTLALLWSVIGTAGLQRLVDWEDVRSEIVALGGTASPQSPNDNAGQHRAHLLSWTSLIAAKHDLSVKNMSSAFADGRIFEAIVDEYTPLIPITTPTTTSTSSTSSLESKLLNLGSSLSFGMSFFLPL
jgi:abnormal spindle-like microcephaly-associated protein